MSREVVRGWKGLEGFEEGFEGGGGGGENFEGGGGGGEGVRGSRQRYCFKVICAGGLLRGWEEGVVEGGCENDGGPE